MGYSFWPDHMNYWKKFNNVMCMVHYFSSYIDMSILQPLQVHNLECMSPRQRSPQFMPDQIFLNLFQLQPCHPTQSHTCQPREKFGRDKRGATERSERTSEGGSGGPAPENFKNLHGKWCNLRYSWAIFVNIISLYCNKTCINYASFITIKSIG